LNNSADARNVVRRIPLEQAQREAGRGGSTAVTVLTYAIVLVIVTALSAILFFLLTGVINPDAPRTALEARMSVAEQAVATNPKSGKVWADLILASAVSGQADKAKKAALDARSRLAKSPDQLMYSELAWAQALMVMMRFDDALEQADRVIELDPEALAALNKKDPGAAKSGILMTGVLGPAWAVKGNSYGGLGKWEEAVKAYSEVLKHTPGAADVLVSRGRAYYEMGEKEKARKDFERALKFLPDEPTATEYLKKIEE